VPLAMEENAVEEEAVEAEAVEGGAVPVTRLRLRRPAAGAGWAR
jgi:hypothetical protein